MNYVSLKIFLCLVLLSSAHVHLYAQSPNKPITQAQWDKELVVHQMQGVEFMGGIDYRLGQEHIDAYKLPITSQKLGGFSTIEFIHKPGETPKFIAFSDNHGLWMKATLLIEQGRLVGVRVDQMGILVDPETGLGLNDIESMSTTKRGMVLAFEGQGKLWRIGSLESEPVISDSIQDVHGFPQNGIESLAQLADGRLFAIAELQRADSSFVTSASPKSQRLTDTNAAWIEHRPNSGQFKKFGIKTRGRLKPSGSTTLNNGEILVLFKDYKILSGLNSIALERFKPESLAQGRKVKGQVLLDVASYRRPQEILDNMEGIASFLHAGSEYVLLASDNNFNLKQQNNRLLLFRLH